MQLPNDARGRETERRMLQWRESNPNANTGAYNREFERVYNSLAEDEAEESEMWRNKGMITDMREIERMDDDTSTMIHYDHTSFPKPPKTHFPKGKTKGIKGAFGKPKWKRK